MDWLLLIQAVVLGIVEGLTEFLPVSSTGHLIIASELVGFAETPGSDTFVVAIQAGAILAVCWYYRARILSILRGLFSSPKEQRLAVNTIVAFLPAAVIGVMVAGLIKHYLFNPVTVAAALVVGGFIILWVEKRAEGIKLSNYLRARLRGDDAPAVPGDVPDADRSVAHGGQSSSSEQSEQDGSASNGAQAAGCASSDEMDAPTGGGRK